MKNFNPCRDLTTEDTANWIRKGDINEAETLAEQLIFFLHALSENVEAQESVMRLGVPWIGVENARLIVESLARPRSKEKGKAIKSGIELFAKVLVPNKPTKKLFDAIWMATVFYRNRTGNSKSEFKRIATSINLLIDRNNQILSDWKIGKRDDIEGLNPAIPQRRITKDQLERAYREHRLTIENKNDAANGIIRNRIEK